MTPPQTQIPNTQQHNRPPSTEALKQLYDMGLFEEVELLKKKYGLNTRLEDYLLKFITKDPETLVLKDKVRKIMEHDDAVLIQGETGTGKELLANALHGGRSGNFIAINCAGMPEQLIESELFGYEHGSFTGSKAGGTEGLIKLADEGTLFLDEIGDLAFPLQAKLLRVIQERTIRKVGGSKETKVDVRFIAATHFDLEKHVADGKFRDDLYARLATFKLQIKPLRERLCDIPLIVESVDPHKTFPLNKVDWNNMPLKHNVREVQSIVRRWQVLGELP